ncbi:restriction endonuclease subunit S [Kandleria vitulina]|uniref:restriction endonuclease subunit S n=1 Tax=Kandleria vitulina TaxID=1630 RepID=UPI0006880898|nr:restriction endonuclease subunit S [Kandleria vitulina]
MAREMKDSGIEWIGQVPDTWKVVKTKYIFENHKEIAGKNQNKYNRLSLTLNGVLKRSRDDTKGLQSKSLETYQILRKGELVFKMIDLNNVSTSRVGYSPYEGLVSPVYIIFHNPKYSRFGYYYFFSMWQREIYNHLGNDGVRSSLNASDMLSLPFLLPPLSEQQKIADFLDEKVKEIDNAIEKTKETIELYKKYKQAIITEAVTKGLDPNVEMKDSGIEWINQIPVKWNVNRLKNLFSFGKGLPITKADLKESGLPVISYGQIHSKTNSGVCVKKELVRFVSQSYYESNPESMTKKGDIIVADTSEDLEGCGNAVYINDDFNIFAGYHTVILKSKENKSNKYIAYLMKTDLWRSQIRTLVTSVKVFSITQSILKQCSVILPPKDSQEEIVDFLDDECSSIDAIVNKMSSLIPAYENYKKSLIYEYVTGKKEVK